MVGGKIHEIIRISDSKTWVNCVDQPYSLPNYCAVYCNPENFDLRVGDQFWWQAGNCYWTPQGQDAVFDIRLEKIGYSHTSRPEVHG